jgi:hypothetical protein
VAAAFMALLWLAMAVWVYDSAADEVVRWENTCWRGSPSIAVAQAGAAVMGVLTWGFAYSKRSRTAWISGWLVFGIWLTLVGLFIPRESIPCPFP